MKEISIRKKNTLGTGMTHTAFPYEKFTDKVIKTNKLNIIFKTDGSYDVSKNREGKIDPDEWEIAIKHPDVFTKVYKIRPRYIIVEKLDNKTFKKDLEGKVSNAFAKFFIKHPDWLSTITPKPPDEITAQDFDGASLIYTYLTIEPNILPEVRSYSSDKKFFDKLLNIITKASKILKQKGGVDAHENNLGYDKKGNIKFLDF